MSSKHAARRSYTRRASKREPESSVIVVEEALEERPEQQQPIPPEPLPAQPATRSARSSRSSGGAAPAGPGFKTEISEAPEPRTSPRGRKRKVADEELQEAAENLAKLKAGSASLEVEQRGREEVARDQYEEAPERLLAEHDVYGFDPEGQDVDMDEDPDDMIDPNDPRVIVVQQNEEEPPSIETSFQHQKVPRRHITIDAPNLAPQEEPYLENPLPGVADEVESYPCKFCADKVFLTSFGLERHTKGLHPEYLEEILEDIVRIQEEWKRREVERERQRERLALAKIRQEALAAAAAREAFHGAALARDPGPHYVRQSAQRRQQIMEEEEVPRETWSPKGDSPGGEPYYGLSMASQEGMVSGFGQSNFESCRVCGLLINADHPTALENHMRAHKKNDELRAHLINTYGTEFVARVTCHECQLVFTDERKLIAHAEAMHVRRRKYVCKWCGHVCLTMTDLNTHKQEIHNMPVSRTRDPETRRQRQIASLTKGHGLPPPLGLQSAATRRAVAIAEATRSQQQAGRVLTSVEELPCRTTCDICGLIMVKPSLLIRHMMRVHNKTNFTATVETKGMPSFKITVDQGKLSWSCCAEEYKDRSAFVYHRRMNHTPKLTTTGATGARLDRLNDRDDLTRRGDVLTGPDGQQYVLLLVNEEEANATKKETADAEKSAETTGEAEEEEQQIFLTPEQLQELGITGEEGENLILMVDDGSGTLTSADGSQLVLDANVLQNAQQQAAGETDSAEANAEDSKMKLVQAESGIEAKA